MIRYEESWELLGIDRDRLHRLSKEAHVKAAEAVHAGLPSVARAAHYYAWILREAVNAEGALRLMVDVDEEVR